MYYAFFTLLFCPSLVAVHEQLSVHERLPVHDYSRRQVKLQTSFPLLGAATNTLFITISAI